MKEGRKNQREVATAFRKVDCLCPKLHCAQYGLCEECRAHHAKRSHLPYCQRDRIAQSPLP